MEKSGREHPVLGQLSWDDRVNSWETEIELSPGRSIRFALVAEADWADADLAELFKAGADYVAWARHAEPLCRERIADDLLDVYNQSWADDDPNEGPPPMTRSEFLANIMPSGITLYHDGSADWGYACGDLFAGHGIWLMLRPDRSFMGKADLVG